MDSTSGRLVSMVGILSAVLIARSGGAGELAQKGREILKNSRDSIVTVSAICRVEADDGNADTQETFCPGLVLDSSGMTVVSYMGINPMESAVEAMMAEMEEEADEEEEITGVAKPKVSLSRIMMRLPDGTEVRARIVLKDKELDIACLLPDLKPDAKAPRFAPIKLNPAVTAQELDDLVVISRQASTSPSRISDSMVLPPVPVAWKTSPS